MTTPRNEQATLVGSIEDAVLAFTVGRDPELDLALVDADCIGTAAHVTMLARLRTASGTVLSDRDKVRVIDGLTAIMQQARAGEVRITSADQDIHLAVERLLTERLGDLGKRVHTARSRNDQVATDLRLFAKRELLELLASADDCIGALLTFARRYERTPMVGRTHRRPAMPSSVGLWASAHAESLLDDAGLVMGAYDFNDRCPLGSAAGYGVPLPIDRNLTSDLLGFAAPCHNVLSACNARGKCESVILSALAQVMMTLSRLAQDLIDFSSAELPWFQLPEAFTTGSSIMPQKRNPDVPELVRAKAARVLGHFTAAAAIVNGMPSGYNRDLQEIKAPFMEGLATTRACLDIMGRLVGALRADPRALRAAFTAEVFAADRALELVAEGMPFREAYAEVKRGLAELETRDPAAAVAAKDHLGGPADLDLPVLRARARELKGYVRDEKRQFFRAISRLLGVTYPELERTRAKRK